MISVTTCPACGDNSWHKHLDCIDHTVSHETFQITACSGCGLLATNPQPRDEDISAYYESADYISHTDKPASIIDRIYLIARRFTLESKHQLITQYSPKPGQLLDYGCGTGDFLAYCATKRWQVTGVEVAAPARTIAQKKTGPHVYKNIEELPLQQFDIVPPWHVLDHLGQPNELLQNLKSVLASDGTLIIAVPNFRSSDANHYKSFWAGYDVPRHLWHFNSDSMKKLMTKNGMKVVHILPMKLDSFYVSLLSEKYINNGKATITSLLKAFFNGLKSNLRARKTHEYSSLIYVIKKLPE